MGTSSIGGMSSNAIMAGFVYGTVGMGFFMYGKKQQRVPPLVYGLALMVLPYVVPGALAMTGVTVALTALFVFALKRGD